MPKADPCYRAYMLRLWQVAEGQGDVWRASLEDTRTGQRQGFGDLEELMRYLRALLDLAAGGAVCRPAPEPSDSKTMAAAHDAEGAGEAYLQ